MNKSCLLLVALFFSLNVLLAQNTLYEKQNIIRIKFKPEFISKLESRKQFKRSSNNYILTGIESIDEKNIRSGAIEFRRVFAQGGKFEQRRRKYDLHLWYEVIFDKNKAPAVEQLITNYSKDDNVSFAEPIYAKRFITIKNSELGAVKLDLKNDSNGSDAAPNAVFNDPRLSEQWHYDNISQTNGLLDADIDLPEAWDLNTGSMDVIVSIHDGGIDYDHEDIANNMWVNTLELNGTDDVDDDGNGYIDDIYGYNLADNTGAILPGDHGTHVAGTVAAESNNGVGVAGVAGGSGSGNGVRLMSAQVFGANVGGFAESYAYAADNGAIISQNSWGYTSPGLVEQSVLDAIDYFIANAGFDEEGNPFGPMQGGIVIFAAGNDNSSADYYPGFYDPVLAVASTNHNDQKAYYSNYGPWVDISAPGGETINNINEGVLSTLPNDTYGFFQGTSMACPHVSGVAALIVSEFGSIGFTPAQLRGRLVGTTDFIDDLNPGYEGSLGSGRMNAFASMLTDDGIAPEAIMDLNYHDLRFNKVTLEWTAPVDQDNNSASSYEVRYSTSAINESNFTSATLAAAIDAQPAGNSEEFTVTGLLANTTYYFAIKSYDFFGNGSIISNVVSVTTQQVPEISVSPSTLVSNLFSGDFEIQNITIQNSGAGTLEFTVPNFVEVDPQSKIVNVPNSDNLVKGEPDLRRGNPILFGSGEDDGTYGYKWIDSNEPGGPVFNWIEISTIGTQFILGDDNYQQITLPFEFPFYDQSKSEIYVSSNGFLSFSSNGASSLSNSTLPNPNNPNDLIALLWDDLNPSAGGDVYYLSESDRFIVQYNDIPLFGAGGSYTFQCILTQNGDIKIQYLSLSSPTSSYTSGIENEDGTNGLEIAYNTVHAENNMAISITRPSSIIGDVTPEFGVLNPGDDINLNVLIQSEGLDGGVYEDELIIVSNDPNTASIAIPVTLNVTGAPNIETPSTIGFDETFIGAVDSLEVIIRNTGSELLSISSISSDMTVFTTSISSFSVEPGNEYMFYVYFTPVSATNYSGILTLNSNDNSASETYLNINGTGALPPIIEVSPKSITENLFTGETATQFFTIENTGNNNLVLSNSINITATPSTNPRAKNTTPSVNYLNKYKAPNTTKSLPISTIPFSMIELLSDSSVIFSDDMETLGSWIHYPVVGTTDNWNHTTQRSNSGTFSWNASQHNSEGSDALESPSISLVGKQQPMMSFVTWYQFDDCGDSTFEPDGVIIQVSSDNGGNWTKISPISRYPYILDDPCDNPIALEEAYSHSNDAFTLSTFDLSTFVGQEIKVRFYAGWDCGNCSSNNEGFYVDDFVVYDAIGWLSLNISEEIISPGSSEQIAVNLDANGLFGGIYEADIIVSSNDPVTSSDTVSVTLNVLGASDIETQQSSFDFSEVFINNTGSISTTIYNEGTDLLEISSINISDPVFSVSWSSAIIDPGDSLDLVFYFSPDEVNIYSTSASIISNDPDENPFQINLNGEGLEPPVIEVNPTELTYNLYTGDISTQSVIISNFGNSDLNYTISQDESTNTSKTKYPQEYYNVKLAKNEIDFRSGHPVTLGSGEDGSFGYSWQDSNSGIDFQWMDISSSGTSINLFDDDYELLSLPFEFPFYDINKTELYVGSNGFISFSDGSNLLSPSPFPSSSYPNDLIAALWTDLNPGAGGAVYYDFNSSRAIIQFDNVPFYGGGSQNNTFQYIFYPDGRIFLNYLDIDETRSFYGVGIENQDGTDGMEIAFNTSYLEDNLSIYIDANTFNLNISPTSGTVASGEQIVLQVSADATDKVAGTYEKTLFISNNDPLNNDLALPVTMNVTGSAQLQTDKFSIDFGEMFVNESVTDSIFLSNNGTEILEITSITHNNPYVTFEFNNITLGIDSATYLNITYRPTDLDILDSPFIIRSNDPNDPNYEINLTGSSLEPPLAILNPSSLQDALISGDSVFHQLAIANNGNSKLDLSYRIILNTSGSSEGRVESHKGYYADMSRYDDLKNIRPLDLGDTIRSNSNFISNSTGMVYVGQYIYVVDYVAMSLVKYDLTTETIINSYSIHAEPYGIAYDGENLWIGDNVGNVFGYDLNGNSVGSFSCPFSEYPALTFNGQDIIASPIFTFNPEIYELDFTGTIQKSYSSPTPYVYGFQYVEQHNSLWVLDYRDYGILYQIDIDSDSPSIINEVAFSSVGFAYSLTHNGSDLLISDFDGNLITLDDGIAEQNWIEVEGPSSVSAQSLGSLMIKLNAKDLESGIYEAIIIVNTNDPYNQRIEIPIKLEVCALEAIKIDLLEAHEDKDWLLTNGRIFIDLEKTYSSTGELEFNSWSENNDVATTEINDGILSVNVLSVGVTKIFTQAFASGCGKSEDNFQLNVSDQSEITSVEPELADLFEVFPNPVEEVVHIKHPGNETMTISLVGLKGEVFIRINTDENKTSVDISRMKSGIYLLVIESESKKVLKRIYKK